MKLLRKRKKVSANPYRRLLHYLKVLNTIKRIDKNLIEQCSKLVSSYKGRSSYNRNKLEFLPKEVILDLVEKRIPEFRKDYTLLGKELKERGECDLRFVFNLAKARDECKELERYNKSEYLLREKNLEILGFKSYKEYLSSQLWSRIRAEHLERYPVCYCCKEPSEQIHHKDYHIKTLMGKRTSTLVTICREHHIQIEFNERGNKILQMKKVNKRLKELREKFLKMLK